MKLTVEQANVLDKIAEKSGMDCWFSITDDLTAIHDVEANRNITCLLYTSPSPRD